MSDGGGEGAKIVAPGQDVRGHDGIYVPSRSSGTITTLPMDEEQLEAARVREKTKFIGFTIPEVDPPLQGLA